ncbi:MAG TPA: FixH family protein [Bacillota bacterium]|nr:FixH family protein [Bacillota bacterium]
MRRIGLFLIIAGLLTACSSQEQKPDLETPIMVEFSYSPNELKVGDVDTLQVVVKQGQDLVSDSKDVKFEVWKDGEEKHEMIDAENKGKGVYTALEKFHEPGVYHIMYHVTARGMHEMKSQKFQVK